MDTSGNDGISLKLLPSPEFPLMFYAYQRVDKRRIASEYKGSTLHSSWRKEHAGKG